MRGTFACAILGLAGAAWLACVETAAAAPAKRPGVEVSKSAEALAVAFPRIILSEDATAVSRLLGDYRNTPRVLSPEDRDWFFGVGAKKTIPSDARSLKEFFSAGPMVAVVHSYDPDWEDPLGDWYLDRAIYIFYVPESRFRLMKSAEPSRNGDEIERWLWQFVEGKDYVFCGFTQRNGRWYAFSGLCERPFGSLARPQFLERRRFLVERGLASITPTRADSKVPGRAVQSSGAALHFDARTGAVEARK